jgi:hypothetical protein
MWCVLCMNVIASACIVCVDLDQHPCVGIFTCLAAEHRRATLPCPHVLLLLSPAIATCAASAGDRGVDLQCVAAHCWGY